MSRIFYCGACNSKLSSESHDATRCEHCDVSWGEAGLLVPCRGCDSKVSMKAKRCPHCRIKDPDQGSYVVGLKATFSVIAIFVVGIVLFNVFGSAKNAALPPVPIEMGVRDAFTANSLVAIIDNSSNDILRDVTISLYDRNGQFVKRNRIETLLPDRNFEIGPLEDWDFLSGYSIKVEIEGYSEQSWNF